jgi:hypothetical protein
VVLGPRIFRETRGELLSVTAEFLHAGLANREAGVWVAPALLGPDKARHMLTRAVPALAEYADSGQLQILDGAQLYAPPKAGFNGGATVSLWSAAINDALGRGFEGLRVAGDAVCNENTDWAAVVDYEATLKQQLAARPIIGLCTYGVQQSGRASAVALERQGCRFRVHLCRAVAATRHAVRRGASGPAAHRA